MSIIIIFFIIILLYKFFFVDKIRVDAKTFFKKGFRKVDNAFGLFCYTGKQGKGKTYSAIKFLIEQKLENNYTIITNVKSFDVFEDTLYMDNIMDIIEYCEQFKENDKNVIIFFDEIFTILEKQTKINKKILSFISQLRKRKIIFVTTAQEWSEINITFRRYVRFQVACNMLSLPFLHTALIYNIHNDGDTIKWNNDTQDWEAERMFAKFGKGMKSVIESYDTYETIGTGN